MKILKIQKLKGDKYKLYIDDEILITYDNVVIDNNLLYKKEIDKILYLKILKDTEYYSIYSKCVKYILKRRRSEKEVREYLSKNNISIEKIEDIIIKLKKISLIDDIEYCKAYINDSIYLKKIGINKIKQNLLNENISIDIIEENLSLIDIDTLDKRLEKIIIKKINSNTKYSNSYLYQHILNEMIILGYPKEKIIEILDDNLLDDYNILNKEYVKALNKLSKKYNGEELYRKIKLKLISKGFNIDKVNELLNKKTENN